ncbi:MAG: LytTR family DNA-binding domain-containing protein, partial [Bacteroidales bacterium]|nr:LytTR family DNA-binding domain-containing protein [Bacteroidales bacterium]
EHIPAVIFTTAYDQYAIRAFEKSAVDYLMKPFSEQRFAQAVKKVEEVIHNKQQEKQLNKLSENHAGLEDQIERVAVRSGRNIHVIPVDEIVYIEAEGDYVMIHSTKGNFLKEKTMKFFENHLPENEFVRVHRSFIINIGFVKRIEAYEKESHIVLMEKGDIIKTSRSGYKALREKLSL